MAKRPQTSTTVLENTLVEAGDRQETRDRQSSASTATAEYGSDDGDAGIAGSRQSVATVCGADGAVCTRSPAASEATEDYVDASSPGSADSASTQRYGRRVTFARPNEQLVGRTPAQTKASASCAQRKGQRASARSGARKSAVARRRLTPQLRVLPLQTGTKYRLAGREPRAGSAEHAPRRSLRRSSLRRPQTSTGGPLVPKPQSQRVRAVRESVLARRCLSSQLMVPPVVQTGTVYRLAGREPIARTSMSIGGKFLRSVVRRLSSLRPEAKLCSIAARRQVDASPISVRPVDLHKGPEHDADVSRWIPWPEPGGEDTTSLGAGSRRCDQTSNVTRGRKLARTQRRDGFLNSVLQDEVSGRRRRSMSRSSSR